MKSWDASELRPSRCLLVPSLIQGLAQGLRGSGANVGLALQPRDLNPGAGLASQVMHARQEELKAQKEENQELQGMLNHSRTIPAQEFPLSTSQWTAIRGIPTQRFRQRPATPGRHGMNHPRIAPVGAQLPAVMPFGDIEAIRDGVRRLRRSCYSQWHELHSQCSKSHSQHLRSH